jgi:hypothetical protein
MPSNQRRVLASIFFASPLVEPLRGACRRRDRQLPWTCMPPACRLHASGGNSCIPSRPAIRCRAHLTPKTVASAGGIHESSACLYGVLIVEPEWACNCSCLTAPQEACSPDRLMEVAVVHAEKAPPRRWRRGGLSGINQPDSRLWHRGLYHPDRQLGRDWRRVS